MDFRVNYLKDPEPGKLTRGIKSTEQYLDDHATYKIGGSIFNPKIIINASFTVPGGNTLTVKEYDYEGNTEISLHANYVDYINLH